jgi:hypothetical protein
MTPFNFLCNLYATEKKGVELHNAYGRAIRHFFPQLHMGVQFDTF